MAKVVPNVEGKTLLPIVKEKVLDRSTIYTDELPAYNPLRQLGYVHRRIHHANKVYVMGDIHTNTIEGFWSLVKRSIDGTYHHVTADYLQGYVDEYGWRYSHRNDKEPMFLTMLGQVVRWPA